MYTKGGSYKMITTLDDFVREYERIKAKGWIPTHRPGPTGIGKTLEDLLGIPENNLDMPDFGEYELKSKRINAQSMLTLLTKAPQPAKANTYLRNEYGYSSSAYDNDEKVLHATLSADRYSPIQNTGLKLKVICDDMRISIASETRIEDIYWDRETLRKAFDKKYRGKFVFAKAESRGDRSTEQFRFVEAYEVSGFSYDAMVDLLLDGKIYVDLRIGQYHGGKNAGKTHDHGTGFRIRECDEDLLFRVRRRIA
jgi:hypothetical protein